MSRTVRFTAEQALDIGSCAVFAIAEVTGLSWAEVWEVAQFYFRRDGLNAGDKHGILRELGYKSEDCYKLIHLDRLHDLSDNRPIEMTVMQAERWLNQNMPDVKLIAQIMVQGQAHAISFRDGKFHNTLGAKKARVLLASIVTKA